MLRRLGGGSSARPGSGRSVIGPSRGAFCQRSISSTPAGKTVSIADEREQERGPGDEAEVADAAELGGGQDVEGHRRGEGSEQDGGAASRRGTLECADERPPEHALFPIAEQEVDAVVDPETDDDGDEHHGEDRQVADEQRDDAQRPAEAQRKRGEHRARGHEPPEREQEQAEREDQCQDTGDPAVPGGGVQLVAEERGRSRDAGLDRRELRAETLDGAPDGDDRPVLRHEGARRIGQIDHDVEQAPVVRQEIAAVGREGGGRDEAPPGRPVRPAVNLLRHLGEEIAKQPGGSRVRLVPRRRGRAPPAGTSRRRTG